MVIVVVTVAVESTVDVTTVEALTDTVTTGAVVVTVATMVLVLFEDFIRPGRKDRDT